MSCLKIYTGEIYTTLKVVYNAYPACVLEEQREKNNTAFLEVVYKDAQSGGGNGNGTSAGAITIALPNISDIPLIGNSPLVKALSIFSMIDKSLTNAMTEKFTPKGKVRPLTKGEIKMMQDNDVDPHDLKPSQGNGQKIDLYRDVLGDIYYRMEGSKFYNPTFYNWYKIVTP